MCSGGVKESELDLERIQRERAMIETVGKPKSIEDLETDFISCLSEVEFKLPSIKVRTHL